MLQCLALHVCIFMCVGFFGLMCFMISVSVTLSSAVCIDRRDTERDRERGLRSSIELHWIPVMAGGGGDGREGEKWKRMEDKGGRCALKVLSQWDGWCRASAFQPFRTQRAEVSQAEPAAFLPRVQYSLFLSQSGICKICLSVYLFSFHYFSVSCIICSASEFH